MDTIGLFYGSTYGMTEKSAKTIVSAFKPNKVEIHNIKDATIDDIAKYTNLIFGTSAWGISEMQDDWEMFVDNLSQIDYSGKKLALFGLGDQKEYPESFVDALGTLYCRLPDKSVVVGKWPVVGYDYYFSLADKDGDFVGLVLDYHNQPELSEERIANWVDMLKKDFK